MQADSHCGFWDVSPQKEIPYLTRGVSTPPAACGACFQWPAAEGSAAKRHPAAALPPPRARGPAHALTPRPSPRRAAPAVALARAARGRGAGGD